MISDTGRRYLNGFLQDEAEQNDFNQNKVEKWSRNVPKLTKKKTIQMELSPVIPNLF